VTQEELSLGRLAEQDSEARCDRTGGGTRGEGDDVREKESRRRRLRQQQGRINLIAMSTDAQVSSWLDVKTTALGIEWRATPNHTEGWRKRTDPKEISTTTWTSCRGTAVLPNLVFFGKRGFKG